MPAGRSAAFSIFASPFVVRAHHLCDALPVHHDEAHFFHVSLVFADRLERQSPETVDHGKKKRV